MKIKYLIIPALAISLVGSIAFARFLSLDMAHEDNFYIHLTSNVLVTTPQQVGNTIGNFITRLPRKYNLSQDYEVALSEISFTRSWYNIFDEQQIILQDTYGDQRGQPDFISPGNYPTAELLIDRINESLERIRLSDLEVVSAPRLIYDRERNKVNVVLGYATDIANGKPESLVYPVFSDFLSQLLGLSDSQGRQILDNYSLATLSVVRTVGSQVQSQKFITSDSLVRDSNLIDKTLPRNRDIVDLKRNEEKETTDQPMEVSESTNLPPMETTTPPGSSPVAQNQPPIGSNPATDTGFEAQNQQPIQTESVQDTNSEMKNRTVDHQISGSDQSAEHVQTHGSNPTDSQVTSDSSGMQNGTTSRTNNSTQTSVNVDVNKTGTSGETPDTSQPQNETPEQLAQKELARKNGRYITDETGARVGKFNANKHKIKFDVRGSKGSMKTTGIVAPKKFRTLVEKCGEDLLFYLEDQSIINGPLVPLFFYKGILLIPKEIADDKTKVEYRDPPEMKTKRSMDDVNIVRDIFTVGGYAEVNIAAGIHSLYLYCDLIQPVSVGNSEVPLIRRIEIPNNSKFGDQIDLKYQTQYYFPLSHYEFDTVELELKDDSNRKIDFAFGRTSATLNFRKRRSND